MFSAICLFGAIETAQLEGNAITVNYYELVHERLGTFSSSQALNKRNSPTPVLGPFLAVFHCFVHIMLPPVGDKVLSIQRNHK